MFSSFVRINRRAAQDHMRRFPVFFDTPSYRDELMATSKNHPIATRLVGPRLQRRLIPWLRRAEVGISGYPTFFDHCSPASMQEALEKTGSEDVDIRPFYGASSSWRIRSCAWGDRGRSEVPGT